MRNKRAFTLIELLVVIAIIAVLMAILMPALQRAREQGQRAVCVGKLKQLTMAWIMYSDANDDRIVNGEAGVSRSHEPAWVGRCWEDYQNPNIRMDEDDQKRNIRNGALFPYVPEIKLYQCPTGTRGELLAYNLMDSMNGLARDGTFTAPPGQNHRHKSAKGVVYDGITLWVKKMNQIKYRAYRIAFIDEGWATPDSFATHWDTTGYSWWDQPPVRHGDGTTVSFADSHVEYVKWKATETIKYGKRYAVGFGPGLTPSSDEGWRDLHFIHKGCWGATNPKFPLPTQ